MKTLFALLSTLVLLTGCIKNNPDPTWLKVNNWTLEENFDPISDPGELTHNFSDAWVYIDNEFIGIFEVPFKIPVLYSGMRNIKIYPTILNNGISATKKIYPFCEVYEVNFELTPNDTLELNPVTRYYNQTNFWIEDFEGGNKLTDSPNSSAVLIKNNDPAIGQWGYYGEIQLDPTNFEWVSTSEDMFLPNQGDEVYLEIDYYNTENLVTGVLALSSTNVVENPNVQLNKQELNEIKWKKIYCDLKDVVSGSVGAEYFKQSFESQLSDDNTSSFIILDNIKVVHF